MSQATARFSACNRLKRPDEFRRVFSSKKRSGDSSLLLIARSNESDVARLGLAVPKKHIHRAVDRNRVKRLIRESFRTNKDQLRGLDVVVVIRKDPVDYGTGFGAKLEKHWKKISL